MIGTFYKALGRPAGSPLRVPWLRGFSYVLQIHAVAGVGGGGAGGLAAAGAGGIAGPRVQRPDKSGLPSVGFAVPRKEGPVGPSGASGVGRRLDYELLIFAMEH